MAGLAFREMYLGAVWTSITKVNPVSEVEQLKLYLSVRNYQSCLKHTRSIIIFRSYPFFLILKNLRWEDVLFLKQLLIYRNADNG